MKKTPELREDLQGVIAFLDRVNLDSLNKKQLESIAKMIKVDQLKEELRAKVKRERFDFDNIVEEFLIDRSESLYTVKQYRRNLERYFSYLDSRDLHPLEVKAREVDGFIRFLNSSKLASATRRNIIDTISSFYSYLHRLELVTHNYFKGSRKPVVEKAAPLRVPTLYDIELIRESYLEDLKACGRGSTGKRRAALQMLPLFDLTLTTGLRLGALRTLKISPDGSYTGRSKGKALQGRICKAIRKRIKEAGINLEEQSEAKIQKNFERKIKRLYGEPRYSWHDLRHYFAVWHYRTHKDIYTLSVLLNHGQITTTTKYLESLKQEIQKTEIF